jgi:hypothetical protein
MKCLFCSNKKDNSDEHIVLNSLNGKLHSRDIICSACNNFFGRELDPIAKKYFNVIILCLGLKNASGIQSENLEGENKFLIQKDLKVKQVKLDVKRYDIAGKGILNVNGQSKNALAYFNKEVKRLETKGFKLIGKKVSAFEFSPVQKVVFDFKTPPNLCILINKIALQFCEYHKVSLTDSEKLISQIKELNSDTENIHYCNLNNEIRKIKSDEITHLLVLKSIGTNLFVYVELFNVVCSIVLLQNNYQGDEIDYQYYQDVVSGEKFQEKISLNVSNIVKIFDQNRFTETEDFSPMVNKLFRRQAEAEFKNIFHDELNKIKLELQNNVDEGFLHNEEFNAIFIERSTKMVAELSIRFPYMIEEHDDANNDDINYIHSNLRESQYDGFCIKYKQLIGLKIEFDNNELFYIEKFDKVPLIEQNGVTIIRVFVVLNDGFNRKYIPYRDFFEGVKTKKE